MTCLIRKKAARRGFALAELLIVVASIAILAAAAMLIIAGKLQTAHAAVSEIRIITERRMFS